MVGCAVAVFMPTLIYYTSQHHKVVSAIVRLLCIDQDIVGSIPNKKKYIVVSLNRKQKNIVTY